MERFAGVLPRTPHALRRHPGHPANVFQAGGDVEASKRSQVPQGELRRRWDERGAKQRVWAKRGFIKQKSKEMRKGAKRSEVSPWDGGGAGVAGGRRMWVLGTGTETGG